MFSRLYSIASNTFVETIRQPIYGAILVVTAIMMVLNVGLAGFTLEDDDKLLRDLGLSTLLLSGLFLSAFSATGVLTREIENKTVLTVVSKPVHRSVFILGKYLGLMAALCLAYYISFLAFAMALRHTVLQNSTDPWHMPVLLFGFGSVIGGLLLAGLLNYINNWEFMGTALALITPALTVALFVTSFFDPKWNVIPFLDGFVPGPIMIAAFLVMLAVMIIAAVALAASTRLGQVMTLLVCTGVLMLGLVSDSVLGEREAQSAIASAAYRVLPNLGVFWIVDAVNSNIPIPPAYVAKVLLYATCQIAAILLIGVALFQKREVG